VALDVGLLTKKVHRRTRRSTTWDRRLRAHEPRGEGGPEEAAAFIAESAADLGGLARRHRLDMISFLLGMLQLEAEELLRLHNKRNLS
jgi:hypothetical protein